jgi:hypothetical protein
LINLLPDNSIYNINRLYTNHTIMLAADDSKRHAFFGEWLAAHCPLLLGDIIRKCAGSLLTSFRCCGTLISLDDLTETELEELAASNRSQNANVMVLGGNPRPESFRQLRRLYELKALDLEASYNRF